jgi:uncharacterized membrane protein
MNAPVEPAVAVISCARNSYSPAIIASAVIALVLKLIVSFKTVGTNDAINFYSLANALHGHSLEWTYQHSRYFNHPPLVAYYLRAIFALTQQTWTQTLRVPFPFLLRLPGILADFILVLVLLRFVKRWCPGIIPLWALILFALSPVSMMVTGFHGNTDSVMVLFLACATLACVYERPFTCGLLLALSCQVKVIPLIVVPAFLCYWWSRGNLSKFCSVFSSLLALGWAEPLLKFPALFARNVLEYGSYWGIWGITYCLRLTGLSELSTISFVDLSTAQQWIALILKVIIITGAVLIGWNRRNAGGQRFLETITYTWLLFFAVAPGVCAQYLIWLAPFVLIVSPAFYSLLVVTSSIFLFVFYNSAAHGFPWFVAISNDSSREIWGPWSLLPWLTIVIAGLVYLMKNFAMHPSWSWLRLAKVRVESV